MSIKFASWITPTSFDPAVRGANIGVIASVIEGSTNNTFNSIATRFVQRQNWKSVKKEPTLIARGVSPAVLHRMVSNVIYWSIYEKVRSLNPDHPVASALLAGTSQVCLTAPLYITATLRQGINPPSEYLIPLFAKIIKEHGFWRGLFLRGLIARIFLSWGTSVALITLIEKHKVISR